MIRFAEPQKPHWEITARAKTNLFSGSSRLNLTNTTVRPAFVGYNAVHNTSDLLTIHHLVFHFLISTGHHRLEYNGGSSRIRGWIQSYNATPTCQRTASEIPGIVNGGLAT